MDLDRFFAAGGALAEHLPGYAFRHGQLAMAELVAQTLESGGVLLAEAGTGTGKTLAYLAPALFSRQKVVISTATKTLQDQLLTKDLPLLAKTLGAPVSAALLKGRQNYLCLRRFERFRAAPLFRHRGDGALFAALQRWAGATESGDRAELVDLPEDYGPWREVCSSAETCWGTRCPLEADCHYLRHRRAAQRAQLVIVNHHLFFADLAVRTASQAEVIPRYAAAIFDEAHHLEAVATQYFGVSASSFRVAELVRDALASRGPAVAGPAGRLLDAVTEASQAFWPVLPAAEAPARLREPLAGEAAERLSRLLDALGRWTEALAPGQGESPEAESLHRRAQELGEDLRVFTRKPEPGEVRWWESRARGGFLHAAPVEVGRTLGANLFSAGLPMILTSATLRAGGSFEYLRGRLGIVGPCREYVVESPFDYRSQCLLYVPRDLPEPNAPSFAAAAAVEIEGLLRASRGRAFCLFTSHRVLRAVAGLLRGRLPYRLLVQGESPREEILRSFREDVHSVLLGAQAFWEGVDVPGEALSAVIIDRLPFASPGDPLVEARIEALRDRGEQPFRAYQLPAAAMALRQGVGRLVRRIEDRGVVVILDVRFVASSYTRFLQESLPPLPLTRDPGHVSAFFGELGRLDGP